MSVRADALMAIPRRASRRRREALMGMGLLLPSAALVLAFTIFPVGYNVWLGFFAKHSLRATSTWVGLGNYTQLLADPDFWRSVWLATVYAVGSTALQIVAGVAGALIRHQRFVHVTLPQLRNVLLIVLLLRGIWMFTKFDVPWLLGFGGGAGEAIRTLPVFTYQRSFTYYQAGMGAALSNVMLALLLMAVTIYFVAFPPEGDETDG